MGLANPWLLLGLASLTVPVLVHLVLREERDGQIFPSLMFVRRIPFELKRRRRLRDRLLLAMRCLALVGLVLSFAGPYFDADVGSLSTTENRRDVVWLLDRSYSMSHPKRWDRAVGEVREQIAALATGERGALVTFDDRARVIVGLTGDRAALGDAIDSIQPGQSGTDLAAAFVAADDILSSSTANRLEVVLVSDLQRSALEAAGVLPLGDGVELQVVAVTESIGPNMTVVAADLAGHGKEAVEDTLTVRVANTGDKYVEDGEIELTVDRRTLEKRSLSLAPGEEHFLNFPIVLAVKRPTRIGIRVGPDELPADDLYHAVLAPRRPVAVALAEPKTPRVHHGVFLEEALKLARSPAFEVRREPVRAIDEDLLSTTDILILDDTALPSQTAARVVEAFVQRGGGLLFTAGPSTAGGPISPGGGFLGRILGPVEIRDKMDSATGAHLEVSVRDHPLWSAAGVDGDSALSGARISAIRRLHPGPDDVVLVRLKDEEPLLVEHTAGAGRMLVLASTADPRWGTLALEPGFVPFVHAALAHLSGGARWRPAYTTGEVVDLVQYASGLPGIAGWRSYLAKGGTVIVEHPGGASERLQGADSALVTADAPGIYEVHRSDGRGPTLPFAVNVGRAESILAAATPEDLERSIVRRARTAAESRTGQAPREARLFSPSWWLLTLAGLALLSEGLLAGRLSRRWIGSVDS